MRRILLTLGFLAVATAGVAHAQVVQPRETITIEVAGLSRQAARAAIHAAVRQVCRTAEVNEPDGAPNCYNATLRVALDELKTAEQSSISVGEAQTAR
jgi:hypothetical protein